MSNSTNARTSLVVRVSTHEPRWHGQPEWPPAPARLFQALVAGAARGSSLEEEDASALRWLETLAPPIIGAPRSKLGLRTQIWVPNNDLDAKGGDPSQVANIRTAKIVHPRLLASDVPFLYAWHFEEDVLGRSCARAVCALAERLFQFGRGIDMAWAVGAVLDSEALESELRHYRGDVLRPGSGEDARPLACPHSGSLERLILRFEAASHRFETTGHGRKKVQVFVQPPMVSFETVEYGGRAQAVLYELQLTQPGKLGAWPLEHAHDLVTAIRDRAVACLLRVMPETRDQVEDVLVGRRPGSTRDANLDSRVRIVPLPSIGHDHADAGIRRVLAEVPHGGPLEARDIRWALSQTELDWEGDERVRLVEAEDRRMLAHYAVEGGKRARVWRTITPAALPVAAARRRLEPSSSERPKDGGERRTEEANAASAVHAALRHAGVRTSAAWIHVQREPFERAGRRAEDFATGTRFAKERLWHVEVRLDEGIVGPLTIGDGRFLGLGVMRPLSPQQRVLAFSIEEGLRPSARAEHVATALRRATLARFHEHYPRRRIPEMLSGHDDRGGPSRDHPRVAFVFDPPRKRVLVILPARSTGSEDVAAHLLSTLDGFTELRAGAAGLLRLRPEVLDPIADPLFASSAAWTSVTPYLVNRHRRCGDARAAVIEELRESCARQGLPAPIDVTVSEWRAHPGLGLTASAVLKFGVAIDGPLLLGRTRFLGGGLFEVAPSCESK